MCFDANIFCLCVFMIFSLIGKPNSGIKAPKFYPPHYGLVLCLYVTLVCYSSIFLLLKTFFVFSGHVASCYILCTLHAGSFGKRWNLLSAQQVYPVQVFFLDSSLCTPCENNHSNRCAIWRNLGFVLTSTHLKTVSLCVSEKFSILQSLVFC